MNEEQNAMRRLFCYYYSVTGNVEEAAIRAGFPHECAIAEGCSALSSKTGVKLLEALAVEQSRIDSLIEAGLKRLAFGRINDAVSLAFSEEVLSDKEIAELDLFNVSELKRVKGGGVEIKLFDRQRALERLWEYSNSMKNKSEAKALIAALSGESEENG